MTAKIDRSCTIAILSAADFSALRINASARAPSRRIIHCWSMMHALAEFGQLRRRPFRAGTVAAPVK